MLLRASPATFLIFFSLVQSGCGADVGTLDEDSGNVTSEDNPNEVMTTLRLTFSPSSGAETFTATWADPELDGEPTIDTIVLSTDETYSVTLEVLNELEEPVEDVTPEILQEMDEHQVFFTGSAVIGPSNTNNPDAIIEQRYNDADNNGYPIGLSNTIIVNESGTGILRVLLRHMPKVNGSLVKTGDLASVMDTSGATSLPGSTDINVEFDVITQ